MRLKPWICAVVLVLSACKSDDENSIAEFVSAVTGDMTEQRTDHVLATYVDLAAEPLDVRVFGEGRVYRGEDRSAFEQLARTRLRRIHGKKLSALQKRIKLDDKHALIDLQLLSSEGMGNVHYELSKHDQRWLLGAVAVH
jgi:hypothetical protein